jgi:hypothetical protein
MCGRPLSVNKFSSKQFTDNVYVIVFLNFKSGVRKKLTTLDHHFFGKMIVKRKNIGISPPQNVQHMFVTWTNLVGVKLKRQLLAGTSIFILLGDMT